MQVRFSKFMLRCLILLVTATTAPSLWAFIDEEGCLLCHKYPKMGRITEDGQRRSYYVMPHVFNKTVHRNVPCRDCHNYIKELPHKEVTTGVTCDTECHSVKNPATGKNFSHKPIVDVYEKSAHGREKIAEGLDADMPYCVTCHTNPLYNPSEEKPPKRITDRCVVCHEEPGFVDSWYDHTSRRVREVKRNSAEIVAMCSACHSDEKLIDRHLAAAEKKGEPLGRKFQNAIESYDKSFHGKVVSYGYNESANCLDCHANYENYYMSVHDIRPSRDPQSSVSAENRYKTCKRCHVYANEDYVAIDPHSTSDPVDNAFRHYAEIIYNWVGYVVITVFLGLALFETIGRRRDGVNWMIRDGSSWRRKSRRGRDRLV